MKLKKRKHRNGGWNEEKQRDLRVSAENLNLRVTPEGRKKKLQILVGNPTA